MSDGFDKEAEREKLREKFAEDEEQREHTQRMSELLLQGATMTNRHCDACGDPIFRHDGQEFCPTCHATEAGYAVPAGGGQVPTGETPDDAAVNESPATTDRTAGSPEGVEPATSARNPQSAEPTRDPQSAEPARDPQSGSAPRPDSTTTDRSESATTAAGTSMSSTAAGVRSEESDGSPGGIDDARASLTRTLTRFARAAEETDDPRRARDHLEAAREAAEVLAALDR
ncbi:uncharacterized Zn finger protein (UPF0148 family) [Halorubrum alkaliphilum]|uniref:Uncharacterized Zn finger protein (UPF0148 family) n=1 Tax=Halorubrum alkaliphilum TaxID=261290 RepID=A0A8T4GGF1_9EURY|nr:Sjogren's syndrome/scleroderma autoantigen 1 family protein [Halorubrum alkaliphilum]MBP1922797.1 uncharacterized Zn finger protein (UPF0148 family) [Halorubrum alkaliphilum]